MLKIPKDFEEVKNLGIPRRLGRLGKVIKIHQVSGVNVVLVALETWSPRDFPLPKTISEALSPKASPLEHH